MTVGCVLFMTEGFLVYRNGALVGVFEPIMAGSSKQKARSIHLTLQASGTAFMVSAACRPDQEGEGGKIFGGVALYVCS